MSLVSISITRVFAALPPLGAAVGAVVGLGAAVGAGAVVGAAAAAVVGAAAGAAVVGTGALVGGAGVGAGAHATATKASATQALAIEMNHLRWNSIIFSSSRKVSGILHQILAARYGTNPAWDDVTSVCPPKRGDIIPLFFSCVKAPGKNEPTTPFYLEERRNASGRGVSISTGCQVARVRY
jgi:hypothetical protein